MNSRKLLWIVGLAVAVAGCRDPFAEDLKAARTLFEEGRLADARDLAVDMAGRPIEDEEDAVALADLLTDVAVVLGDRPTAGRAAELLRDRELSAEGRVALARAFFSAGDSARAGMELKKVGGGDERPPRALLVEGQLEMRRHNPAGAVRILKEAIAAGVYEPYVYMYLGFAQLEAGEPDAAERTLREARTHFPDSPDAAIALATLVMRVRPEDPAAWREAAGLLGPALKRRATDHASRVNLARLHRRLGELAEAEAVLTALVKEADAAGSAAMWNELGIVRRLRDDTPGAVEAFRRAAEGAPRNADFLVNLGEANLDHSRVVAEPDEWLAKAEEAFKQALKASSGSDARAYEGLGRISVKRGEIELASARFHSALRHDPRNVNAHLGLALIYYEMWADAGTREGEGLERAREHFRKAAELLPVEEWPAHTRDAWERIAG